MRAFCILFRCVAEQFAKFLTVENLVGIWLVAAQKLVTLALTLVAAPL